MNVAINSCTLIPPTLKVGAFNVYGKYIPSVEINVIRNVNLKAVIARKIMLYQTSVDIKGCLSRNSLKEKGDSLSFKFLVKLESLSVPAVIVFKVTGGVVSRFFVGILVDYVIVGEVNPLPAFTLYLSVTEAISVGLGIILVRSRADKLSIGF